MWDFQYIYSISVDFSNKFDLEIFIDEITNSSITKDFLVDVYSGTVVVFFQETLTGPEQTTLDNIVLNHQARIYDYPNYFKTITDNIVSTTTSSSYMQKLRLTTDDIAAGNYKIEWFYNWSANKRNVNFEAQIELDDTTVLAEHFEEPVAVTNSAFVSQGYVITTLTKGIHTIDLDYRRGSAANSTVKIWNVTLTISIINTS